MDSIFLNRRRNFAAVFINVNVGLLTVWSHVVLVIIFIHDENGRKGNNKKYIRYNGNTYYAIFKQKRKKS